MKKLQTAVIALTVSGVLAGDGRLLAAELGDDEQDDDDDRDDEKHSKWKFWEDDEDEKGGDRD